MPSKARFLLEFLHHHVQKLDVHLSLAHLRFPSYISSLALNFYNPTFEFSACQIQSHFHTILVDANGVSSLHSSPASLGTLEMKCNENEAKLVRDHICKFKYFGNFCHSPRRSHFEA